MKKLLFIVFVACLLVSCQAGQPNKIDEKPITPPTITSADFEKIDKDFLKGVFDFNVELASEYLLQNKDNQLISPLSIFYAFSAVAEGSQNDTKALFEKLFKQPLDEKFSNQIAIHKGYLNQIADSNWALSVLDSIWIDDKLADIHQTFVDKLKTKHYSKVFNEDLGIEATADKMNHWVLFSTNQLIDPKIKPDPDLLLMIMNTIYFKDGWLDAFSVESNSQNDFYLADKTIIETEYMHQYQNNGSVFLNDDYVIAQQKFKNGMVMKFLLPTGNKDVWEIVADKGVENLLNTKLDTPAQVVWSIPLFEASAKIDLKDLLSKMGYADLFSVSADFSNLAKTSLYISSARQLTKLILNNEGVEAAAYTEIETKPTAFLDEANLKVEMNLNKPFLYVIEWQDSTPLFFGILANPKQK